MLNNHKPGISERRTCNQKDIPWIIDIGASNHMTESLKSMIKLQEVSRCPVGLPDEQYTEATNEGLVKLDRNLKL